MAETVVRVLQLLTLLQRRRHWPGSELAERLEVSERTLRRDIDRLRRLGYTIGSDPGVDGGYELQPGPGLAPLLLDDDEAVALAVSLHLATRGETDLAEAAVSTLTKVLSILPPRQRRHAENIVATTATDADRGLPAPPAGLLAVVAGACRDSVRLAFEYQAGDGRRSRRYVEPCRLVSLHGRWYLVAFDCDRDDWRTFRLDRLSEPAPAKNPFPKREPPAEDLHDYVRSRIQSLGPQHHVVIDVERPAGEMRERWGRWVEVTTTGPDRSRLEFDTDSMRWPLIVMAETDAPCTVVEPPELLDFVARAAERFDAASSRSETS